MSPRRGPVRSARRGGELVARRREFEWLARAGLVARGVVYGTVGVGALKRAVGSGGKATPQRGALTCGRGRLVKGGIAASVRGDAPRPRR